MANSENKVDGDLVVYRFPYGKDEVRAVMQPYGGKVWTHVRRYYAGEDGQMLPGKGIGVPLERLPELHAAVEALMEASKTFPTS